MNPAIQTALYRLLLRLYPGKLRRRWEDEMVETFALQLAGEPGWTGGLQVWAYAIAEIFQIALPLQAARADIAIPAISLAGSGAIFFALTWALANSPVLSTLYRHLVAKLGG